LVIDFLLSLQPVVSLNLDLVCGDLPAFWPFPDSDQSVELVEVQHYTVAACPLPVCFGIALEREVFIEISSTFPQPLVVFFPPACDEHDPAACCAEDTA
jgi:hypothetical protein